jgi:hypothetical protein
VAAVRGLRKVVGLTRENIPLWGASIGHGYVHWFPSTFFLLLPLIKKEALVLVSNVLVIFSRDARDPGAVEQSARRKG